MAILYIKNADGVFEEVPAIIGPQGPKGDKGDKGEDSLPAVTANDNGKFLRVVDGAWVAASMQNAEEVGF